MEKEITFPGGNGTQVKAFIASPENARGKLPAVLLIHEIFGLDAHIHDVARRLAKEGYFVLAPDLMYGDFEKVTDAAAVGRMMPVFRNVPREAFGDPEKMKEVMAQLAEGDRPVLQCLMAVISGRSDQRFINDLIAAYNYMAKLENVNPGKVASMGFCFGGGMAGALSVNEPRMAAHIVFYGKRPPADKIKNITAPVQGIYGSLDTAITSTIPGLAEEMKNAGKKFQYVVYEGAMHAFFNDARPQVYNKDAAVKAWEVVKTFLKENLQGN
ncbi:MAG: dienelactone hydrolase family protein [Bacteroidia bacterium]